MLKRDLKPSFLHVHVHLSGVAESEQTPRIPKVLAQRCEKPPDHDQGPMLGPLVAPAAVV